MTDEEIEKVVNDCGKGNCTSCSFYKLQGCLSVVDYIRCLKAENIKLLKEADDNAALAMEQKLRADKLEEELKTVRQEEVGEIERLTCIVANLCETIKEYKAVLQRR